MEHNLNKIEKCPLCGGESFELFLESKDYSVSKEDFKIVECSTCSFRFTNPIPAENKIGQYYKSSHYISHTDSNKGLFNKIYKAVRKRAMKSKQALIESNVSSGNLLDIGCGTGDFLLHMKGANWNVKGLEPDDDARRIAVGKDIDVEHVDALHTLESSSCDIITMWHVLEHVYHLDRELKRIVEILKPGGYFVVAVPNHTSWDAQHYKKYWAAYDLPIHLYHFKPSDMKLIAEKYNLDLKEIVPMKWDAYYVSMLSEEHMGKNKWRGIFKGLKSNMQAKNDSYSSQIYVFNKKSAV